MSVVLNKGDAFDILPLVKGKSIDLVLTDPPYNVSRPNNFKTLGAATRIGMDFGEWDKEFDIDGWIDLLPPLLKENANVIVFTDWKKLSYLVEAFERNHISPKRCLVLSKSNPAPFNRDRMFVNDVEFAIWGVFNSKDKPTKWTFNREQALEKCVFPTKVQSAKLHPTMKDLEVMKKLIRILSNEGDIVLDPFIGSGTTAVACESLKRDCIGIEVNENYYKIACERLKKEA